MSEAYLSECTDGAIRSAGGHRERLRAASWLALAAAPIFAIMALLTGFHDGSMPNMLCAASHNSWPPVGMVWMYALMTVFHLGPWLRLRSTREMDIRSGRTRPLGRR
jgi:hypothetical protein